MKQKPIGGYFGLELDEKSEYHNAGVALNSASNALRASLLANDFTKIYLPHYTCQAIIDVVKDVGLDYSFYEVNAHFEPATLPEIGLSEVFFYTNYWGLKKSCACKVAKIYDNAIIDNAQAFYSSHCENAISIYSCRKFFGVPDGGYIYDEAIDATRYPRDVSYDCADHLLKRVDSGPEKGYESYQANEQRVAQKPIARMSRLTRKIMRSIRYSKVAERRRSNFMYIDEQLQHKNELTNLSTAAVPLAYPLATEKGEKIRSELISRRVYVPQYWPSVLDRCEPSSTAHWLARHVIPLPIDQRYSTQDMDRVLRIVNEYA